MSHRAAVEPERHVHGSRHAVQPVLRHQDRRPVVVHQALQGRDHVLGTLRVELARRLVQDQDPRAGREGRRDRHALLLAAGQRADAPRAQRLDVEQVEHLLHPPPHVRGRDAEVLHPVGELVLDAIQHERGRRVLRHERDDVGERARRVLRRVASGHVHAAARNDRP